MNPPIEKSIRIQAPVIEVWDHLTNPALMIEWTGEPEMNLEIITDWVVGNPFTIKGFHHTQFVNSGVVLQFVHHKLIQYSHLSSVSALPNAPENYTITTFSIRSGNGQTTLNLRLENFPTESIFKHLNFYWENTLTIIKTLIEKK